MNQIAALITSFTELARVPDAPAAEPLPLGCTVEPPATDQEITAAWRDRAVPEDLSALWTTTRTACLFEDLEYGQWGLRILSPDAAAARTSAERAARPDDVRPDDIVVGEFLGDQDLLVRAASGEMLVALPLDDRADWYRAAPSLVEFLERYLEAQGEKFWE